MHATWKTTSTLVIIATLFAIGCERRHALHPAIVRTPTYVVSQPRVRSQTYTKRVHGCIVPQSLPSAYERYTHYLARYTDGCGHVRLARTYRRPCNGLQQFYLYATSVDHGDLATQDPETALALVIDTHNAIATLESVSFYEQSLYSRHPVAPVDEPRYFSANVNRYPLLNISPEAGWTLAEMRDYVFKNGDPKTVFALIRGDDRDSQGVVESSYGPKLASEPFGGTRLAAGARLARQLEAATDSYLATSAITPIVLNGQSKQVVAPLAFSYAFMSGARTHDAALDFVTDLLEGTREPTDWTVPDFQFAAATETSNEPVFVEPDYPEIPGQHYSLATLEEGWHVASPAFPGKVFIVERSGNGLLYLLNPDVRISQGDLQNRELVNKLWPLSRI